MNISSSWIEIKSIMLIYWKFLSKTHSFLSELYSFQFIAIEFPFIAIEIQFFAIETQVTFHSLAATWTQFLQNCLKIHRTTGPPSCLHRKPSQYVYAVVKINFLFPNFFRSILYPYCPPSSSIIKTFNIVLIMCECNWVSIRSFDQVAVLTGFARVHARRLFGSLLIFSLISLS